MRVDRDWLATRMVERPRWHVPVLGHRCSEHAERMAQDRCDRCGRPFCPDCLQHLQRWRVCSACLVTLQRERSFQTIPQRLRRGKAEGIAAFVIVLVFAGGYGLIQHQLGSAGSDASLAATARQMSGVGGVQQAAGHTGHPTLQLSSVAVGGGTGGLQVHGWVSGSGFQSGETVQVTAVWTSPRLGGAVVTKTLGPFTTKTGGDGVFAVYLDFGMNLPWTTGRPLLLVTATGDQGSSATLRRDDLLARLQGYMQQQSAGPRR